MLHSWWRRWWQRFRVFLTPPTFEDDDETRIAAILNIMLLMMLLVTLTVTIGMILNPVLFQYWPIVVSVPGLVLLTRSVLRRGYLKTACQMTMWGVFALVTVACYTDTGLYSITIIGYVVVIIMAGMLIDGRTALVVSGLSALSAFGMYVLWEAGIMVAPPDYFDFAFSVWLIFASIFAFCGVLIWGISYTVQHALVKARQRTAEVQRFFDLSLDGLIVGNDQGYFTRWNPAFVRMTGHSEDVLRSQRFIRFVHPDDFEATVAVLEELLQGNPVAQHLNRYRTSSGDYKWLSWSAMRDGALVYVVARDVTERLQAEQALRDQEAQQIELTIAQDKARFLSQFLVEIGEITHDLKMPLSVINTSLYFLERPIDEDARHERILRIQEQTMLMQRYIQNILAISQLERAEHLELSPIDLNVLATSTYADYRSQIERKALRVTVDVPDYIVQINADQTQLYRAMTNLVENAIQYTPDGGAITLRVLIQQDFAAFEVKDTGIGIDSAEQAHVFERFFRGSNVRTGTQTGTGLGLAIVRKIAEMHGGSVEVSSILGQGSTFTMRVPLMPEPVPART